ncbi:MAG TPA: arginase family protein [Bacteroidales bacterium]|nr:arginase family protein [Bacteroidales bacterium]HPI67918.1 arginase family protein [Bacteroidales bacterium]HPR72207.1 arginase family protein [Bacteroidales bacterium]
MIDLNDYFSPVSIERPDFNFIAEQSGFPHNITVHTESMAIKNTGNYKVAFLGVPDGRNSPGTGTMKAPDLVRTELYRLTRIPGKSKIIDLGNMKNGVTFNDTVTGLRDVLVYLIKQDIFPVVLGGSSALTLAVDKTMSDLGINYTLAGVDSRIDYINEKKAPDSFSYLNTIIHKQKSYLRHYINIGYQTYLNDQQVINRFNKQKSEMVRIGDARKAIHLTEPLFRDSEVAVFDMSAVRQCDAPGSISPSPNGFYGEEICLLARYAGISDKLKIFCLFDVDPEFDIRNQTTGLAAQILWFFLEGFSQKQYEVPALSNNNSGRFIRYHVRITDLEEDLIFIKSTLTDRWWMELKSSDNKPFYIACSHEDYLKANHDEIPDRWVQGTGRPKN